ncbi:urease accessory protein UreD [Streptomyces sp. HNM0575]|uniref:urease accessory protein UreD n=1 Tax=Streptomyces sp. HNM0575 TaxID=2716338 RepID=UPI00145D0ABE|nr:urease accessory protein UreD [Streptomyces sp. HNM0575]NLU75684.1 urease accessory protein UreD [Streptomyces sp. HNM0575]
MPRASAVRAAARVTAVADGRGGTAVPLISGSGPLAPRLTRAAADGEAGEARVTLVGAMSAPLGGDRLAIEVRVEAGARLRMDAAAATLALPGRGDDAARYDVRLTVGEQAHLRWLPGPVISAAGSRLRQTVRVELAPTARLELTDVLVLGRSGEEPGRLTTRLTVDRAGHTLLDQQLDTGAGAPGWNSAAVLGPHRAVGQLLVVDPDLSADPAEPSLPSPHAVVTPLEGPAVLVTALGADALAVTPLLRWPPTPAK